MGDVEGLTNSLARELQLQVQPADNQSKLMQQTRDYIQRVYPEPRLGCYMFPTTFISYGLDPKGKIAEETVYNALKAIKEPMICIHSKKYCVVHAGEIDFLICHKDRGIIIFEVKSSVKVSAFNSALRQLGKAQVAVKCKIKKLDKKSEVRVRYAVVLPNVLRQKEGEFAVDVCYSEDLSSTESLTKWLDKFMPCMLNPLTGILYETLSSIFLEPFTDTYINSVYNKLIKLTPQQAAFVEGITEESYICGPAGSGKTEVLIIRASAEELQEQQKLVVVFNNPIKEHLENRLASVQNIEVKTFSKLLWDILHLRYRTVKIETMNNQERVKRAIQVLANQNVELYKHYDSIFVDEGQSMEGNDWECLIDLLHKKGTLHLKWIFFDDNQAVGFSRPPKVGKNNIYHLKNVIRNTVRIFEFSEQYYLNDERKAKVVHGITGPDVEFYDRVSKADIANVSDLLLQFLDDYVGKLLDDLKQLDPGDVGIIVENQTQVGRLTDRIKNGSRKIHAFALNEMVRCLKEGIWKNVPNGKCGVTVDSVSRCAGLDFKVVIALLNRGAILVNYTQKMYLAVTRACCKLVVVSPQIAGHVIDSRIHEGFSIPMDIDKEVQ